MSTDKIKPPAIWKKAASTSSIIPTIRKCNNDHGEEESASSARRIPNTNSAALVANTIRSHSPRKMKTQIAKLVYNPSINSNSNRDADVNENEKTVVAAVEAGEFEKKRQDRDREVKEIHEILNEFTKSPIKQKKTTEVVDPPSIQNVSPSKQTRPTTTVTATIQRSKTDTNLRRPTARRIQPRQEAQTARCKSAQRLEEKNSPPKVRPKGYSSEEAQRYMQEQKKKRRSLQMDSSAKPAIDKDEIKKRLENLRQSTRKIVDKNVKIAKKKAGTENVVIRREEVKNGLNKDREVTKAWPERVFKAPAPRSDEKELRPKVASKIVDAWTDSARFGVLKSPPEKRLDPCPLAENHKKIGLLRKPEFKDHSFSAIKDINMDKENLILDNLTPSIPGMSASRLPAALSSGEKVVHQTPTISSRLKDNSKDLLEQQSSESSSQSAKSLKRKSSSGFELKIPEAKLRSRTSVREKSVQADSAALGSAKASQHKTSELPYWLKPTSVQAYPYNFIMAVRKKLEAIANPPSIAASSSSISLDKKKPATETPLSYPKNHRNQNVKRRIMDQEEQKSLSNKENIREPLSFSEITSNFSSMSIQLPESANTKSHSKPVDRPQPQRHFDEDDTTVSSSIFSSPEKKKKNVNGISQSEAISPLATDNITNLQIKSKSMMSNITLGRGDQFENTITSSHSRRMEMSALTDRSDDPSVNFSQLLDDFNRSLSQVIEVNQQLKTTLVKSQIFSPEKKTSKASTLTTSRVELAEYVSDFEESSSQMDKKTYTNESGSSIHEGIQESSPSHHNNQSSDEVDNTLKSSSESSSNDEEIPEEESKQSSRSSIKNMESPVSIATQTFVVSPDADAKPQTSTRTQTIHEETIEESPNKENMSANQYSLDSLETSHHEDYIKSHINTTRGDYERIEPPPSYKQLSSESQARSSSNIINSSMESEFVRIFNKSDMEISVVSMNRSLSESTVNYSSIGMYEKLIQNETYKSDHLAALLKMREKALIDRTKGQIAWLEVQKERYKTKGLVLQISAVKKKQRGILLKMEKEREEIKKLLQRTKVQRDDNKLRIPENRPFSDVTLLQQRRSGIHHVQSATSQKQKHQSQHQQQQQASSKSSSSAIVRGYELETSRSLEQLLQKREEDLRRRREHVERLMEWHRRLDQEEAEVLQLERILLNYNNVQHQAANQQQQQQIDQNVVGEERRNPNQIKMEKKLKDIDRSLRELSSISTAADVSTDARGTGAGGSSSGEFVRTSGTKLNKLWRRLTSQRIEKFLPNKKYKLCKADVEQLYEDAKLAVLHDFGENAGQMEVFLGQTSISASNYSMEIPQLNLNFSSGQQSEEDHMMMHGNYSPRAAEEEFVATTVPSTSSRDDLSADESRSKRRRSSQSSTSALQSVPEGGYSSSSSGPRRLVKAHSNEERSGEKSRNDSSSDMDSKSGLSTKSSKSSKIVSNTVSSSKTEGDLSSKNRSRKSVSSESIRELSTKNESVPSNSVAESFSKQSKTDIAEDLQEKQSDSHAMSSPIESNLAFSTSSTKTLEGIVEDMSSSNSAGSDEVLSQKEKSMQQSITIATASVPEFISKSDSQPISSFTGESNTSDSKITKNKFNLPKISPLQSVSTESQLENNQESILKSTTTKDGSSNSSNIVPITENSPSESLKLNSSSIQSEALKTSAKSEYSNNFESKSTTEMGIKSQSRSHSDQEAIQSDLPKSSAEEVSILKSLLNSNSIFMSNQASTAASDIKAQFRTNGHDFQNWPQTQIYTNDENSSKDDKSIATQFSDETTLKSIKSIDNSTNSKHSIDPPASATIATPTENNEDHSKANSEDTEHQEAITTTYSSAFEDSNNSNQIRSSVIMSVISPSPAAAVSQDEIESETLTNAFYESDFTEGEETNIDDISQPKFETTGEEEEFNESQLDEAATDLEKRLINLDVSLKDLDATFEKALSPEKTTSPSRDDSKSNKQQGDALMPDIISEVELRRRHQAMLENELKQFEHAVPYMYVREIPNKPPPPYVPPAHGSPMTTIFPSEERIKDITFRRTQELYHEILNIDSRDENGKKPPSVLDENITNIYERIILDICKEYLTEYKPILTSADPNNFHSSLAFFNPPDRLRCMQEFIYKEVRKNLAMDKTAAEKNNNYSVYGHRGKRDHIGEIIIQEMFEEDNIWSNFYVEEEEVLELILDELIGSEVRDICSRVLEDEIPNELNLTRTTEDFENENGHNST